MHHTPPSRRTLMAATLWSGVAAAAVSGCGGEGSDDGAGPSVRASELSMPAFFDEAPVIRVRDPLSEFLGAAEGGLLEYRYADAVRLAGHSCPVVAGSFLMVLNGLERLYGTGLPERGGLLAGFAGRRHEGVVGVYASIITLLTGAAPETGFAGLAGRFSRRDLLAFEADAGLMFTLRRKDTGAGIRVGIDNAVVPADPDMAPLQARALSGQATEQERRRFGELWQDRVRRMLIDNTRNPKLVLIEPLG